MKFNEFHFRDEIQQALDEAGYDEPMPIQEKAIPILMEGRDLIGVAETGTGKTLAFLLPIFQRWSRTEGDPLAAVLCPTRELAIQVAGEAERFGRHLGIRVVLAYGGTSSHGQRSQLVEGCDLVVGTPGRVLDFVTSAWLSFRKVKYLVLDEADRMLDMGFINDIDAIIKKTPMSRQTMLFSATIPEEVRTLAERYMFDPQTVKMHRGTRVKRSVDHVFFPVASSQKDELLVEILRREKPTKALIFSATREGTSELASLLRRRGFQVISLSSLLSQANRERALDAFRKGECPILVATDVAARGLDITDIDLVVNFDPPMSAEEYVHRIGRTGRAARSGRAATLISELDDRRVAGIERLLGETVREVKLEGFDYKPARRRSRPARGRGRPGGGGTSKRGRPAGKRSSGRKSGGGKKAGGGKKRDR